MFGRTYIELILTTILISLIMLVLTSLFVVTTNNNLYITEANINLTKNININSFIENKFKLYTNFEISTYNSMLRSINILDNNQVITFSNNNLSFGGRNNGTSFTQVYENNIDAIYVSIDYDKNILYLTTDIDGNITDNYINIKHKNISEE